jgi:hypothetical protein
VHFGTFRVDNSSIYEHFGIAANPLKPLMSMSAKTLVDRWSTFCHAPTGAIFCLQGHALYTFIHHLAIGPTEMRFLLVILALVGTLSVGEWASDHFCSMNGACVEGSLLGRVCKGTAEMYVNTLHERSSTGKISPRCTGQQSHLAV